MIQIQNWDKLDNNELKTHNMSYEIHIPPNQFYEYVDGTQQIGFHHYEYYATIIDEYKEVQLNLILQLMGYKKGFQQINLKIILPNSIGLDYGYISLEELKDIEKFKNRIGFVLEQIEDKVMEAQEHTRKLKHLYPNANF